MAGLVWLTRPVLPEPRIPALPPPAECLRDDDCPTDRSCRNQLCVNPCAFEDACAVGAFCHVEQHRPVCRCPAGFEGTPTTGCRPPAAATVGCSSNQECGPSESCVNRLCVSPCNCGPNAECQVTSHYPVCFCKPGYSGNPQIGCVKRKCILSGRFSVVPRCVERRTCV